jgi:uncharacterized protein (TIGR02266 family)
MSVIGSDRRQAARVAVDFFLEEHTGDALYYQRATNLSIGGVYLERTLPHPPGTRVDLRLRLPGDPALLEVKGEVIESPSRDLGMGVRFVDLSQQDRARIAECLFNQASQFRQPAFAHRFARS